MTALDRLIRRYSAYYHGWCQSFGEHEIDSEDEKDINWLIGEDTVGMIIEPKLRRELFRELLGKHRQDPVVEFYGTFARIHDAEYPIAQQENRKGLDALLQMLEHDSEVHLFLTYHFFYPSGTRIVTFSKKKPLLIMYKEIEPLAVKIVREQAV